MDRINLLSPGASLYLFCPGNQNSVQIVNNTNSRRSTTSSSSGSRVTVGQNMTRLECNRQSAKFEVNNVETQINRLNCTKSVMGDLVTTRRKCGPRSEAAIHEMGFKVNNRTFMTLIEACYNSRPASAVFVRYQINGKAIKCEIN